MGYSAFSAAGDADYNVAIGCSSAKNLTGNNNVAVGNLSLNDMVDGDFNIAIGNLAMGDAGQDGKTVDKNVGIGASALKSVETGNHNVAIGENALQHAITSSANIAIGYRAMFSNNHVDNPVKGEYGSANVVIGDNAAYAATGSTFHANVLIGSHAGHQTKGKENVLIGEYAGHDLEAGQNNVVIGAQSARFSNTFETNTNSCIVGYRSDASANGNENENVFGNQTIGAGSNTVTIGNQNVTDIYMASDSGATIHAAGISGSAGNLAVIGDISGSRTATGSFGRFDAPDGFYDSGTLLSDYVFEDNYNLRSLEEVEAHISESKHLPGVPGESNLKGWQNMSLGSRDTLFLEKIEELTLYILQLDKRIKQLENK